MNKIIIKTSIWKTLFFMFCSLAFAVVGFFMLFAEDNLKTFIIGIACMIFFGGGFFILLFRILNRAPRLVIDEKGVNDTALRVGQIEWGDIASARLLSVHSTKFIALELIDSKKYRSRLSNASNKLAKLNQKMGFGAVSLNLSAIDMNPKEVYEIIQNYLSKNKSKF